MTVPSVKLDRGIHVMHLFYRVNRVEWSQLGNGESSRALEQLEAVCQTYAQPSHPRIMSFATVGGKGDLAFILFAAELGELSRMHREIEACFPPGTVEIVYSYFSVTELSEYMSTEEEHRKMLVEREKLEPGSATFEERMAETKKRLADYEQYRLYPEMPDWEVMGFYPMNKRRLEEDNWYLLDFDARKKLMGGHARVGRKYAGRVSQLITGSTGLDDWEWGVTLLAHQVDALKEIVYEMRFDEVSARYAEFGPFFINMRLAPAAIWDQLKL